MNPHHQVAADAEELTHRGKRGPADLRQIVAGAECRPVRADHDDGDAGVAGRLVERSAEILHQREREWVPLLGTVEGQGADPVGVSDEQVIGHASEDSGQPSIGRGSKR